MNDDARARILILSFSNIAADARVLKQVTLLSERYHVDTCGYGSAPAGVATHYSIPDDRAVWRHPKVPTVLRQFRRAYWGNPAVSAARELLPVGAHDVVLANDIDSVGLALSLEPEKGVHADLHEYSPRQREDLLRWRLVVAPLVRWMCREFLPKTRSVTTVGVRIAEEYRRRFGVDAQVVRNAAPYVAATPGPVGSPIRAVHSGAALRDRGIDTLVAAVEASRTDVSLDLYLTLNDPAYVAELRERTAASSRVAIHDPVPYARLSQTLNGHDVGIHVLPPTSFNNRWALPNKLFDYIQARLGVIVGPSPEMASLVENAGVGAVATGFGVAELTAVLDGLNAATVQRWKGASDEHARELSSEAEVGVWLAAVERILAEPAGRAGASG